MAPSSLAPAARPHAPHRPHRPHRLARTASPRLAPPRPPRPALPAPPSLCAAERKDGEAWGGLRVGGRVGRPAGRLTGLGERVHGRADGACVWGVSDPRSVEMHNVATWTSFG